jgi:hypothetical protein
LPVIVTTGLASTGDDGATLLWLLIARAGGVLALLLSYQLAARLAGRAAGLVAAAGLALATGFLYNAARGDSEGWLVVLALWAILLHLDDRRHAALLAGAAAGLLRPEVWLLLGVYALALVRRDRSARTVALVAACGLAVIALWVVPERIGSGEWLRAAERARKPAEGSPGQSMLPFVATLANGARAVVWPLFVAAVFAVAAARRRRPRTPADAVVIAMGAAAVAWTVLVALMAEAGFTGNLRYLTVPAALICVLGAVGLPEAVRRLAGPGRRAVAGVLAIAGLVGALIVLGRHVARLAEEQRVYGRDLPALIHRVGGTTALAACGAVGADHFSGQAVAWRMHRRPLDIRLGIDPRARTVLGVEGTGAASRGRPPVRLRHGDWVLRSDCPLPRAYVRRAARGARRP